MRQILIFITVLLWNSLVLAEQAPNMRYMLGQKLMLDLRYFCTDGTSAEKCRTPVTGLPDELAKLLAEQHIGGVILFAENIQNEQQLKTLTTSLQSTQPELLFIATDQEGGRVARLPSEYLPAFGGPMAMGAVPEGQRLTLARQVAIHTGNALREVGVNLNFAPTIDVNSNPDNPVINVRSFGDNPQHVAELGLAMTQGLLATGVVPALKHFPGHGDTHVDSHAGLPVVTHNKNLIMQTDIYPFVHIIAESHSQNKNQNQNQNNGHSQNQMHALTYPLPLLPMVMTAHIQYPALDNSTLTVNAKSGLKQVVRPATLSKTILTEVLREDLGFTGLVVTDALDMAGITQFFSADIAVLETWRAGSDIALMPYTIRTPSDVAQFKTFLDQIEEALTPADKVHIRTSFTRIKEAKHLLHQHLNMRSQMTYDKNTAVTTAFNLAQHSITTIKPIATQLHKKLKTIKAPKLLLVMPDELRCQGLLNALLKVREDVKLTCLTTAIRQAWSPDKLQLNTYDAVLWGELSPAQSVVEMGGMEDWQALRQAGQARTTIAEQHALLDRVIKDQSVRDKLILLGLRAPYAVMQRAENENVVALFALYDYRVTPESLFSPTLSVFAEHLLLGKKVYGELPVQYP